MNPLLPNAWEWTVTGLGVLVCVLLVAALIDVARSSVRPRTGVLASVLLVVLPVVGPAVWFLVRVLRSREDRAIDAPGGRSVRDG
ncbi:MAG: hypothetical protein ABWX68_04750 [Arthrobacter sp.]|uniref:hypothetical protein n=1 Tax=Arthrobacter sp. TaxID=1667 RepID=UPI003480272C